MSQSAAESSSIARLFTSTGSLVYTNAEMWQGEQRRFESPAFFPFPLAGTPVRNPARPRGERG